MKPTLPVTLALALATFTALPHAAGQTDDAGAEIDPLVAAYQQAQEHFLALRYTEALPLFQRVADGNDSPIAWLYVARTQVALGRPVSAHAAMLRAIARASALAPTEPRYEETLVHAREEMRDIETAVGRVTVRIVAPPPGTVVELAGEPIAVDEPVIVAPGLTRISAFAPERGRVHHELDVAAGRSHDVVLELPPPTAAPPPPPTPPPLPPPTERSERGGGVRIAGIVVGVVAVGGWVTFGAAAAAAESLHDDLVSRCGDAPCSYPGADDDIAAGRRLDVVSSVGLGVGAAATVASVLMIAFGGPEETEVGVSPTGLLLRGRF